MNIKIIIVIIFVGICNTIGYMVFLLFSLEKEVALLKSEIKYIKETEKNLRVSETLVQNENSRTFTSDRTDDILNRLAAIEKEIAIIKPRLEFIPDPEKTKVDKLKKIQDLLARLKSANSSSSKTIVDKLVDEGETIVPYIIQRLDAGNFSDYGGGVVIMGSGFHSYPDEFVALLDALRLIGTPEAEKGFVQNMYKITNLRSIHCIYLMGRTIKSPYVMETMKKNTIKILEKFSPQNKFHEYREVFEFALEYLADDPNLYPALRTMLKNLDRSGNYEILRMMFDSNLEKTLDILIELTSDPQCAENIRYSISTIYNARNPDLYARYTLRVLSSRDLPFNIRYDVLSDFCRNVKQDRRKREKVLVLEIIKQTEIMFEEAQDEWKDRVLAQLRELRSE